MRKRYWLLAFVALIGFGLSEVDRYTRKQPVTDTALEQQEPDYYGEVLYNRHYGPDGSLQQTFAAQKSAYFSSRQLTEFTAPLITLTDESGQHWQVEADKGQSHDHDKRMTLSSNVQIRPLDAEPEDDLLIETSLLHYYSADKLAETDQAVEITNLQTHITAIGMRLDLQSQQLQFEQQVNTRYAPQPSD